MESDHVQEQATFGLGLTSVEPNEIGIDEFVDWCRKADSQVMQAVNMGRILRTPEIWLNTAAILGTFWSDLRRKNSVKIRITLRSGVWVKR